VPGLAQVARQSTVPIATGERLTTKYEFARVLEARAAAIVQPNLGRVGGLLEGKKVASIAEAFGAQLAPHCYNGPIGLAANIQLATCSPNFLIIESIRDNGGFHADLLTTPIEVVDGRIVPPTAPGLGVELNEGVARAHPYTGDRLHLTMWDRPIDVETYDARPSPTVCVTAQSVDGQGGDTNVGGSQSREIGSSSASLKVSSVASSSTRSAGSRRRPAAIITLSLISIITSGCSVRKLLAFSRPWPSCSPS
jgi:hypothetical protein